MTPAERATVAVSDAAWVTAQGDAVLNHPHGSLTPEAFNATARAVAILAFTPGGIDLYGQHFDAEQILACKGTGTQDPGNDRDGTTTTAGV